MSVIIILMSISSMSHVDLKKCPCRPVDFKGQGPHVYGAATHFTGITLKGGVIPQALLLSGLHPVYFYIILKVGR